MSEQQSAPIDAPYYRDDSVTLWHGDSLEVLRTLPDASVDCCVTSPPYFGLRDYGEPGQYGLESSPAEYVETMRAVFAEMRRVLVDDGTLWLNLGDSYAGKANAGKAFTKNRGRNVQAVGLPAQRNMLDHAPYKSLMGMPWRTALALIDDGWALRNEIIWAKPNAMPESITDRLSTRHEHVFLFAKSARYWFDVEAIKEPAIRAQAGNSAAAQKRYGAAARRDDGRRFGGNATSTLTDVRDERRPGDVWSIPTQPFPEAHFAAMPPALAARCVAAGCKPGGVVLDPFSGSGTTGLVAIRHGRRYVVLHVDHVVPVSLGGTNDPWNLVAACWDCNAGKTNGVPTDELIRRVRNDYCAYTESIGLQVVSCRFCAMPIQIDPDDDIAEHCYLCDAVMFYGYDAGAGNAREWVAP